MPIHRTAYLAVVVWLALTVLPNSFALAGETITVHLASGRTFSGVPDARSDEARLWLKFGGLSASVLRLIEWSAIVTMQHNEAAIEKQAVLELAASGADESQASAEQANGSRGIAITIRNAPREIDYATQAAAALELTQPATHLDFYATLENWDADPQPDGLLLHVTLLNAAREPIAANGSLQVELFAPVERRFQAVPHGRGASVLPLARWSHSVRAEDFHYGEAVLQLPFTAAQPIGNDLASSLGLVHVRMAVPGHGVFEDSYDGVQIRPFSPTRGLLERQDRRRTVFTEPPHRTGNVR